MKVKVISGLVAFVVGIIMIIASISSMRTSSQARGEVHKMQSSKNPIMTSASKDIEKRASQYGRGGMFYLVGGIILVVVGGGLVYMTRKKKRKG